MARAALLTSFAVEVPSPALQAAAAQRAGVTAEWHVPVEVVIALTSSVWARLIKERRGRVSARPTATVMRIDGRLYAEVVFQGARNPLFFPLDRVALYENREGRS